jgi:hypothetical protein
MKMMCQRHGEYHYMEDFRCPQCVQEMIVRPKEIRERVFSALMTALPEEDDPDWENPVMIQDTVQRVLQEQERKLIEEQSPFSMTSEFDYGSKALTLYLIPRTVRINITLSAEKLKEGSNDGEREEAPRRVRTVADGVDQD